jgi:hypothetical protein
MTPAELLGSLRRRGVLLAPGQDGRLRYRPRAALTKAERALLARNRDAIVAWLDAHPVGWRAAVMATQVPRLGAITLLLARPGVRFPPGTCSSCGDPLGPGDRYRCGPCVEAAVAVLEAAR